MNGSTELYPFQKRGVRAIHHYNGRVLLADEMGLGKTYQVLQWLKEQPDVRPVVVVTPAHLKGFWQNEARRKTGLHAVVLNGIKPTPIPKRLRGSLIIILNYEILKGWVDVLLELEPQCLVIEEAHYCKNRRAKRTKLIRRLAKVAQHCIAISGTPLLNRPAELFPTLNMLWPEKYPSFFSYATRYCNPVHKPWGMDYKGAIHIKELHNKLTEVGMIRRRKADVLQDLPLKQRTVIPVNIELQSYMEAQVNFLTWLAKQSLEKAERASKALEITKLGYLKRLAATEKLPQVISWIDDYLEETNDKLVIYGIHKAVVRSLYNHYRSISVCLDGSTPKKERATIVRVFQQNKRIRLFIGNIQAAGTGITLTAASRLLFAEIDWVPANMTQAEDRVHRIGQKQHVDITYLVAKGTIEEKLCEIIQRKQQIVSQTLDGETVVGNELNVFDALLESMKKENDLL